MTKPVPKSGAEDVQFSTLLSRALESLSPPQLVGGFLGLAYVIGYLIHSIFIKQRGVHIQSLLKAEYLEIGIVFLLLSLMLIAIPIGIACLVSSVPQQVRFFKYTPLMMLFITINFLYILLFVALFLTSDEWDTTIALFGPNIRLFDVFHIFLLIVVPLFIGISYVRVLYASLRQRIVSKTTKSMLDKAVNMAVTTCKCILLTAILAFDFLLLKYVPWVTEVLIRMKYYVAMLLILSAVVTFVPFRIAKLKTSLHKNELLAVGALFCIPFLYLTITAYSQTVYKLIPTNRGGSYSVVQACVRLDEKIGKRFSAIMDRKSNNTTIPVFVIEETADTLYLVRPYSLFSKVERDVYAIGKHNVRGIDFSANSYRHPTVNPISR